MIESYWHSWGEHMQRQVKAYLSISVIVLDFQMIILCKDSNNEHCLVFKITPLMLLMIMEIKMIFT